MKSAETSLIDFLRANPQKYASAELQRMTFKNRNGTTATARSLVRRLEENAEIGGTLEVSYLNGSAFYQIREQFKKPPHLIINEDAKPIRVNGVWRGQFVAV